MPYLDRLADRTVEICGADGWDVLVVTGLACRLGVFLRAWKETSSEGMQSRDSYRVAL